MIKIFVIFLVLGIIGVVFYYFLRKKEKLNILKGLDYSLFLITLPRFEKKETQQSQDFKQEVSKFEEILVNFSSFKEPVALEIASQTGKENIHFYIAVPKKFESACTKYIQGVYPQAHIEKIPQDYIIFEPGGYNFGSFLTLKNPDFLPINTYKLLSQDPISTITNIFSEISVHDGLTVQIILKPAKEDFVKKAKTVLSYLKKGESLNSAVEKSSASFIKMFKEGVGQLLFSKPKTEEQKQKEEKEKEIKIEKNLIDAIEAKISKKLFEVNIRLIASSIDKEKAKELLENLEGGFLQFSLQNLNEFTQKRVYDKALKKLIFDYSFRRFNKRQKIILNTEEITSLYHFPLSHIESPKILWQRSKEQEPPTELPQKGEVLIGQAIFRGRVMPVYFASKNDRRRHFYIIGQTGTGKTSLLQELIRQDIEAGRGVGVVDPHGDLIESTLANVPKQRIDDVVLFEPFDLEHPMGLNMLEWELPEQKDFAVQEMIAIFHKLFPPEIIGPMFEHYMRNAMLALMADKENPGTLVEIPRIFTDDKFMEDRLRKVTDPVVRNFWEREWKQTTGATKSDMLGYVVSKVGRFVENEMMRNIIGQSRSSFNFEKIMDEGKIFLANLSKGQTGEVNSSLLGLIIVSKLQMAAMRRGRIPEEQRKDFYLYIDEFQNFTTDSIATILSEARKYRLNLTMAHQFIPQLPEEIKNAVMGNVGSICCFRIGADDAEFLERQFEPFFSKYDLVNLDNFNAILKLMIEGKITNPFKFRTIKPKQGNEKIIPYIKRLSKIKYSRKKQEVEKEILERSKLGA